MYWPYILLLKILIAVGWMFVLCLLVLGICKILDKIATIIAAYFWYTRYLASRWNDFRKFYKERKR